MKDLSNATEAQTWAEMNFKSVQLLDSRRTTRLVEIARGLAEGKGPGLARLGNSWYTTKAIYHLLKQETMTPEIIQSQHRELACQKIKLWEGDVLLLEDSSEFNWNAQQKINGLGPIGSGRETDQGFLLHSTLALGIIKNQPSRLSLKKDDVKMKVLGLPAQQYYVRPPKRNEKKGRSSQTEPIETDLWRELIKNETIPLEARHKVVRVCDRNADIYEVIMETASSGCSYIIRARHDRALIEQEDLGEKLFESMREQPSMGQTVIERRGREGVKKQIITLELSWQKVNLRAPVRPGFGLGKLPPLEVNVIRIWGTAPETGELIEWILHTNLPIRSLDDAIKITQYYALRWVIEDYHKALKSGMRAEDLQLQSAHSLFAAIAIMSVVALRLIELREILRIDPDAPAQESGLDELEIKVLGKYLKREITTVRCVALAVGRLGGHQNRRSDGMPGMMSLWEGMTRLMTMVEGVRLVS